MDGRLIIGSVTTLTAVAIISKYYKMSCILGKKHVDRDENVPEFLKDEKNKKIFELLVSNVGSMSNDSLVKIVRQLNFWLQEKQNVPELDAVKLTQKLIDVATWRNRDITCPKVRFGRTEIQMPIITCGSMRFQHTWMPDMVPVLGSNKKKVLQTPSQTNLTEVVRQCLKRGINHFETARMYGSSEIQLSEALQTLIRDGEIKRSDFILQTKLPVSAADTKGFKKYFDQSWEVFKPLGYIDLLSFWCISTPDQADYILSDEEDSYMSTALQWKKEGKVRHLGFSTHGTAEIIMKLIESNKFEYVNIHYHFFGSYHAEGTPDGKGGHGNLACVKRALELDMGVFNISPVDKGGQLYQPSATVARLVGPELSPIAFAALHSWETANMHTISVGLARPEDLDEVLDAAMLFNSKQNMKPLLLAAEERLIKHSKLILGEEWHEKSLLNFPSCFDEASIKGFSLGHIMWCSNMINAYGMYDCAKARYGQLEKSNKWNDNKSFKDNIKAMSGGNPGRGFDESCDVTSALINHLDPTTALEKLKEIHKLLSSKSKKSITSEERKEKGWEEAYDLRPWNEYPDTSVVISNLFLVVLQNNFIGKLYYSGGGPTPESIEAGDTLRQVIMDLASGQA